MENAELRRQEIDALVLKQQEAYTETDERRLIELREINLRIRAGELDWEVMETTPLDVGCHLCHSQAGEPCKNWSRIRDFTFHDRRITQHRLDTTISREDAEKQLAWRRR